MEIKTETNLKQELNSNLPPMQVWLFNQGLEGVVVARTEFGAKQLVINSLLEELGVDRVYVKRLVEKLECRGVGAVYKNAGLTIIASFYTQPQIVCTLEPTANSREAN